jgi:hypothetical protein
MADRSTSIQSTIGADQYYTIIRGQIEHEDNLIGQRLSYFVAAQSFLFTAYAITLSNFSPNHITWVSTRMKVLLILIPVAAVLTCALIYMTVIAGLIAMSDLRRLYREHADHSAAAGLPPVQGYRRAQLMGQAAPIFVPLVFIAGWLIVLANGLT